MKGRYRKMEDRWTVYIRERAKGRTIPNPWLKERERDDQAETQAAETGSSEN